MAKQKVGLKHNTVFVILLVIVALFSGCIQSTPSAQYVSASFSADAIGSSGKRITVPQNSNIDVYVTVNGQGSGALRVEVWKDFDTFRTDQLKTAFNDVYVLNGQQTIRVGNFTANDLSGSNSFRQYYIQVYWNDNNIYNGGWNPGTREAVITQVGQYYGQVAPSNTQTQATYTPSSAVKGTPSRPSSVISKTPKVARWMAGVTCGTGGSHCFEIGGHINVTGLPEKLSVGETYKVDVKFDYEWADHQPGELSIQSMDIGFVTDSNVYGASPEESNVYIDYLTEPGINPKGGAINPNWIGFDSVTLNKKIKVGESFNTTAYITILKKPQPTNAYLLFDMRGSQVLAGVPDSNYLQVQYQGILPALAVKTVVD